MWNVDEAVSSSFSKTKFYKQLFNYGVNNISIKNSWTKQNIVKITVLDQLLTDFYS